MENNFRFKVRHEGFSHPNKPQIKSTFTGDDSRAGQFKKVPGIEQTHGCNQPQLVYRFPQPIPPAAYLAQNIRQQIVYGYPQPMPVCAYPAQNVRHQTVFRYPQPTSFATHFVQNVRTTSNVGYTKPQRCKAIPIINPITSRSIFEDDTATSKVSGEIKINAGDKINSTASADKAITTSYNESKLSEPEASLPKVSDPLKQVKPVEAEPENVICEAQDVKIDDPTVTSEPTDVESIPVSLEVSPIVSQLEVNETNKNTHQTVTQSKRQDETNEKTSVAHISVQDLDSNSIEENSLMPSPSRVAATSPNHEKEKIISSAALIEKVEKIGLIEYFDDQWSPSNTQGKKYYTRDQLLKLKDKMIIAKLPDYITDTLMKKENFFDPIKSIAPRFMKNQMNSRNPYQKRPNHHENNNQALIESRGSQTCIIELNLGLRDSVKLNQAENAWKPSHLVEKKDLNEEDRVTQDLLGRFRSMLNKLTAENFDFLVDQVKLYKIDTSERLDGVIRLVFEKAISEPNFAPTYAKLCKEVAFITTAPSGQGEECKPKGNTLKTKIITQCQREFERHQQESIVFNDIEAKLRELENLPDLEKRVEEKSRLEEEHYRVRQRANGTVKFIGELFKIDMLKSKTMRSCIEMLLHEVTEEKIERVCKLLTTIGGKLENEDGRKSLDGYFKQLKEMILPSHKVINSSRIKFEIQNLQDLRNRGWKPRQKDEAPKTMNQIQMEAENEQKLHYQTRENVRDNRQRGGYDNRRQQQQQNQNDDKWSLSLQTKTQNRDNDEWLVQHNKKSRAQPNIFSNILLPRTSSDGPKLGDANKYKNFSLNKSAPRVDTKMDGPRRLEGANKSASRVDTKKKNSSIERNAYHSRNDGNATFSGSRNSSQMRSRDNSLQAPQRHQQILSSGISSSKSFSSILKQSQEVAEAIPAVPISLEKEGKNSEEILKIFNSYHKEKLKLDVAIVRLGPLNVNKDVLVEIYNKYLDHNDIDRVSLMMLIHEMLKKKILTHNDNRDALTETMSLAPEMQCDVPRIYEYISQFFGELIIAVDLNFQDVYDICQDRAEDMLMHIFTTVAKRHGASKLQQIYANSNCKLEQFIKDGNLNCWLEKNNFINLVRDEAEGNDEATI